MINNKKHKIQVNKKILFDLIIVSLFGLSSNIFFASCNNKKNPNCSKPVYDTVYDASTYEEKYDHKDSIFIGGIMMGCTKSEFNKEFKTFLSKTGTLNGLKIQQHKAFFVNGKLVRLILFSEPHFISHDTYYNWQQLYKEKYNQQCAKSHKYLVDEGEEGIIINKKVVSIEVYDRINTENPPTTYLYDLDPNNEYISGEDSKELNRTLEILREAGARNINYTYLEAQRKYHSMIDIYDRFFIAREKQRIMKEYENQENQREKNRMKSKKII